MKSNPARKIEEKIIYIALKLARRGEGGLFLIVNGKKPSFKLLVKQNVKAFDVSQVKNEKLVESLATIDGAVVISKEGNLSAYGAMIKSTIAYKGFGTRHAAALSGSLNGNTCILSSEEERKVKIFKNGKYIMQLDALEKNIDKKVPAVSQFFESIGAGFLGTIGAATLLPALGITIIPGVIIFGGSYYAIKSILDKSGKK
ncbi:MAG: diadenylate cyclase [archaeon]